jgi:hypothetical protein
MDFPALTMARFEFELECPSRAWPRGYLGSALRGGFGLALKHEFCLQRPPCDGCLCPQSCVYGRLFECKRSPDEAARAEHPLRGKQDLPPPYLIEPPPYQPEADNQSPRLRVGVVLIGQAIEYLPYLIYTFDRFGHRGIGRDRTPFRVASVSDSFQNGALIYDRGQIVSGDIRRVSSGDEIRRIDQSHVRRVRIEFVTPVRLQSRAGLKDFYELVFFQCNRLAELEQLHGRWRGQADFFRLRNDLLKPAKQVKTTGRSLRTVSLPRWSNRQKQKMTFEGLIGAMDCEGDLDPVIELLSWGEHLHVGNQATFGLGQYRVTIPDERGYTKSWQGET